jgi:hypothetical protein
MTIRSGELAEMEDMLRRAGVDPSNARRLSEEGIGPHELASRLAIPSGVGSLQHSHGISTRRRASEIEREIAEALEGGGGGASAREKRPRAATSRPVKISTVKPATMTAGAINKELDRLDEQDSALGRQMIDAGRGHERPSEYLRKTDPLSSQLIEISERKRALHVEISMRYGPNAPTRLPTGRFFGPRKRPEGE